MGYVRNIDKFKNLLGDMMMSEKRFERWNNFCCKVKDNQEETLLDWEDVIHKLNEQQDIINDLNGEFEELSAFIIEQRKEIQTLKEENKYLKKRIKVISDELYCKDRKLEELGVSIECCDKR